jgi:hypothetical protein
MRVTPAWNDRGSADAVDIPATANRKLQISERMRLSSRRCDL